MNATPRTKTVPVPTLGVPAAPPLPEDLEALLHRLRLPISAGTPPRSWPQPKPNAGNQSRSYAVLAHCGELLGICADEWLRDDQVLLLRAIDALKAGHHEAAMALAVAVGESLGLWASVPRVQSFESEAEKRSWDSVRKSHKYSLAKIELAAVGSAHKLKRYEVLRHALIAPIPKFFTPFHARPGEVVPDTVSRHATVHQPTVAHLTADNALVATMLGTSILRDQQSWCDEVRMDEAMADE
jgi:hypothetical protein